MFPESDEDEVEEDREGDVDAESLSGLHVERRRLRDWRAGAGRGDDGGVGVTGLVPRPVSGDVASILIKDESRVDVIYR